MTQEELFKKLVAHCKEYGFVFPSSEIYDGLGAVYDYGQNGVELKNNIKRYWWDSMVKLHENIVGLDAAIFMHPRTWEASGHVGAFNDPLIDNKDSKKRYRADVLIEDWLAKQDEKVEKEVEKARKRFGESFDEEKYRETSPRVAETLAKRDEVHKRFVAAQNASDLNELRQIIVDCEIATGSELLRKLGIVLLLTLVETDVLENEDLARLDGGDSLSSLLAVGVGDKGNIETRELSELLGDGLEGQLGLEAGALGTAEVAHENDASVVLNEVVDGGQGSLDAGGVANDAILDRHVEVNADENALAVDIDVADGLLGKGHVCFYLSYVSASHYGRRFLIKRARP